MKMNKLIVIFLVFSMLFVLFGCSNGSTDDSSYNSAVQNTSEPTNIVNDISDADSGLYRLHSNGSGYDSLQAVKLRTYTDFSSACALSLPNGAQIPNLSKGSDTLVVVDSTVVKCKRVEDYGYTLPCYFKVYDNGVHDVMASLSSVAGGLPTSWQGNIEEINGNDPNNYYSKMVYTNPYYLLNANYGDTYTIGLYKGTDFTTYSVTANVMYFSFGGEYNLTSEIKLPVEKTKNGYFIVDFSSLENGVYAFDIGTHEEYFIEIK